MRFPAAVEPAGNATGIEVPAEIVTALGAGQRPKVAITINGHTWRSRIASTGGRFIVGISAANRAASGIAEGDRVEAELQLDTAPRVVAEPPDLAEALDGDPQARAAFDHLAYGLKRKHVHARALLGLAEAEAQRAGFGSLYLYTHDKMTENLALYSKIGYVEYDRRPQGDFSLVYLRKHLA